MNKTYKVIFSKVRGALMVCNEITSSVQKKGIQLVVAAAGLAAMAGASAADVLTITGTPTTAGSLQKARITGQFVKNPTDGVTGSHPTNQWWFINPEDIHALSATYFSQVELKDIQLETYPGGEAKGWTRMSGIETVSLDNVNLSISGTEENSKSFIWANSLTTSGQENTIYVGGLGPGVGEFKLDKYEAEPYGSLTLGGQKDKFQIASDRGTINMTVGKADINSTTSATFLGHSSNSITLTANNQLTVKTPLLVLSQTTIHSKALAEFSGGASQTITFESGSSGIHADVGLKANGLTIETKSGATGTLHAPSQQTNLTNIKIDNQGSLTIDAKGGKVTISELKHSAKNPSTILSGNVEISAVNDGFSGKLILAQASSYLGNSTLTLSSAVAKEIAANLNMGSVPEFSVHTNENSANKLVINDATNLAYNFDTIRTVDGTGNSFVTVEGIVKTTDLLSTDRHFLKETKGLESATDGGTITINYGDSTAISVKGLGNTNQSSLRAGTVKLQSGLLQLGDAADGNNSVFGEETPEGQVNFEASGSSELSVLGDTVHFGTYTQSENSKASIAGGAGTFNVHGNATLAGNSFKNSNTAGGNTPGVLFHSSLTLSSGDFETSSGAITTVKGTFNQTGGNTKVLSGGQLNVLGETTLSSGGMNLAGNADFQKVFLSGGQLVSSGSTNVKELNQTTDTPELQITDGSLTANLATLRKAGLTGGKLSVATADLSSADINFKNTATVEIADLKAGTDSLGKITVDDGNESTGVTGKFVYNGTNDVKMDSLSLGGQDTLDFSARNAKLALDAANLKSDAHSLLNWDVKETTVTGTGENFKGQMNLVDVEAKTSGSTLNMVSQAFDAMFGQGKGKLNLGAKGTTDPQVRNILNVTGGELNLTNSSDETGSLVSGEGLIIANSGITLGAKYSGKTELQTAGKLSVGDNDGHFTLGSDSQISAAQLAVTPAESAGRLTVNGTLNLTGGESDIGSADIAVAPTAPGKGLNLDGSTTKLTTTGKITATGTDALKVAGAGMTVGDLETNAGSTLVTNNGTLTVNGTLKATGDDAIKVSGSGSKLIANGDLSLSGNTNQSVIEISGSASMTAKADKILRKGEDGNIASVVGGRIGVTDSSAGYVDLDGITDWISNNFNDGIEVGKKKISLDQVSQIMGALNGNGKDSRLLLRLGDAFNWSDYEIDFGEANPIDYDKFKLVNGVAASDKDIDNVNGNVTGTNSWKSAKLKQGEEKLKIGSLGEDNISSDDDVRGDLTLNHPSDGIFVKNSSGAVADVELIGSAKSGDLESTLKLIGNGEVGSVTGSGNNANTKLVLSGEGTNRATIATKDLGTDNNALGVVALDNAKGTVIGGVVAGTLKLNNSEMGLSGALKTRALENTNNADRNRTGDVKVTGQSSLNLASADIGGSLTIDANSSFKTKDNGNVSVKGATLVDGSGSSYVASGDSNMGDVTVKNGATFGYDAEGHPVGGKLKTMNGSVTVSSENDNNRSRLYASELDIDKSLSVKAGDVDTHGPLTVKGNSSFTSGAKVTARDNASLGSLDVKERSSFDIGHNMLKVLKNPVDNTTATSGDVNVSDLNSSVSAGSAEIAGNLTVKNNGSFMTSQGQTSTGNTSVDGSVTLENKGIVQVAGDFKAGGKLALSKESNFSVDGKAEMKGLIVDTSNVSVGDSLTVDTTDEVLVKNGGALSAGNALLNEVKVENDPENAIKTNKLSFGKEGGLGTRIKKLYLAGNTELTFNTSSDSSTDAGVNVVNDLTVASGVNATINGIAAQCGAITVNGNLDAQKIVLTATQETGPGTLDVAGNSETPALARFGELDLTGAASGSIKKGLLAVGGQEALDANIESLREEAKAALKSARQTDVDVSSILYINSALSAPNGTLTVGDTTGMQFGDNTFGIGTGGFMILDRGAMDEPVIENGKTKYTAQLTGNIVNNGKMMFKNVKISGGTVITLADGNHTVSGDDANFLSGNFLYDARLTGNNLTFKMSETGAAIIGESLSESLQEMVMDLAEGDGFDSSRRDGAGWIASVMEDVTGDGNRTPEQIGRDFGSALESVSRMTAQSGTFLVTDTVKHVAAGSVEERLGFSSAIGTSVATEETFGRTLWATPLYNKTKADAFKAGKFTSGSDVDLYGITVGADVVVRDDTRLGAALYAGSGKADSRGSLATTKNDFDFYGAALYFGHNTGAWSFMGDLGFGYVTNDVKQTNHGLVKSDMDSTVFTAGLKAKYAFDVAGMQVAPFAGLRLNHVDSKNYSAKTNAQGTILNSYGTAKTYAEVPLGVQLSRNFMTQTGWTIKPALDLAVTPVVGSKNLTETIRFTGVGQDVTTSSEVLDRMRYSAALGVSGGKDKVGFGVSVGYSGSKNTDAFSVKANVRWTF